MINKKMIASLLIGAATLIGTALPMPVLASNNNAALNMMAMQMYMQQQANAQNQAILAQAQAQATYNAAQAAWAANTIPTTQVAYYAPAAQVCVPTSYVPTPVYNAPVYSPVVHVIDHVAHDISRDIRNQEYRNVSFRHEGRR